MIEVIGWIVLGVMILVLFICYMVGIIGFIWFMHDIIKLKLMDWILDKRKEDRYVVP